MSKILLLLIFLFLFNITGISASTDIDNKEHYTVALNSIYKADYLSNLEKEIIIEMNKVRTNPSDYAETKIKPMLKRFKGKKYIHKNTIYNTKEGAKAVEECYRVLLKTKPSTALYPDKALSKAAIDHMYDQGSSGAIGHIGGDNSTPIERVKRHLNPNSDYIFIGENISYGLTSADDIIPSLLIDDGIFSRDHRKILLNPKFNLVGVACGYHKIYETMCVIVYGRFKK
jgi:uncharacterized protein YkwD